MRPLLADTSWYIARSREEKDPLLELAELSQSRDIAVCGIIVAELGRRIRQPQALQRYIEAWQLIYYVPSNQRLWHNTLELTIEDMRSRYN